ncbi:MAG TPA: hypothetical protein VK762_11515 [Polyangiaceae bacterium]|nr:hypothetical protein [Polyangiaceae bacterium]
MRSDLHAGFLFCLSLGLLTAGCSSKSDASAGSPDTGAVMPPEDSAPAEDALTPGPSATDAEPSSDAAGASPPDAGAPGDGGRDFSTDRSTFFGDSRCADAGVQLCEDFENGMIGPAWTVSGTKPVVDTMQHARGTHALHITQHGNGLSYIKEAMTFPEANDTYFGRVFVYFKSLPATLADGGMPYAHWTMLAASGTGVPGEIRVSGQLQNGRNLFGVGTDNQTDSGTGDWTNSDNDPKGAPTPVPLGQWLCVEWMHKGDTSETQFWWDGALHPSLSTTASMHGGNSNPYLLPQFNQVWVGWQEYQTSGELFELWIDEIAIDSRRIGCVL